MVTLLLYTGLLSTGLLLAADEPAANAALAEQVKLLLVKLDSEQLTDRNEAERKLLELGAGVLPLLPTIGERTSAEVALRVTRVQQKLLQTRARASIGPSTVTLSGADLPLSDVLAAIAKQTGNPITDHRQAFGEQADDARIKVDFDKTPFWPALDRVLDQANLTLYGYTGERGAFVIARPAGELPRAARGVYAGLFRLEPARFEAVRDLRNPGMQSLKFFLEATWEPRLQPIAILQPLDGVKAVGDAGEAIAVGGAQSAPEASIREGISAVELEIPLLLPERSIKKISSLKGKLLALVPGEVEQFRFRNLPMASKAGPAKRVEQRKAGATVIIDQLRKNNQTWQVSLRVRFDDPSNALESHRGWILDNQAFFETTDKRRIEPAGMDQSLQSANEVGLDYLFDMPDDPAKLVFVYSTPITILEMPVEYEFKDLSLP